MCLNHSVILEICSRFLFMILNSNLIISSSSFFFCIIVFCLLIIINTCHFPPFFDTPLYLLPLWYILLLSFFASVALSKIFFIEKILFFSSLSFWVELSRFVCFQEGFFGEEGYRVNEVRYDIDDVKGRRVEIILCEYLYLQKLFFITTVRW